MHTWEEPLLCSHCGKCFDKVGVCYLMAVHLWENVSLSGFNIFKHFWYTYKTFFMFLLIDNSEQVLCEIEPFVR